MLPLSILLRRIAVRLTGYAAIASRTHGEKFGLSSASGDRWRTDCVATIAAGALARVSRRDEKSSLNRFWLPAPRASGVPHALFGREIHAQLERMARRGRKRAFAVIASAAKQSILPLRGKMDCFASLAMTAGAMDCFAEPVIGRAFVRPVGSQ